jgi:hypothetical protein
MVRLPTAAAGMTFAAWMRDGDQLGEASLAVDQRQVAQVAAVMLN